jgi:hypothetical protein
MFGWLDYVAPGIVAHAVLTLSIVVALGLMLGPFDFGVFASEPPEFSLLDCSWVKPDSPLTTIFWNLSGTLA